MSWFRRVFFTIAVASTAACGRSESIDTTPEALPPGAIWDGPVADEGSGEELERGAARRAESPTPLSNQESFAFASTGTRKSVTIGALDDAACSKALKKHKIPHIKATGAPKIDQPIIITGPIDGVHFDTGRPYAERTIAKGDAVDCRLAVALVDLARIVKKHGITHVMVKSFHRPTQQILDPAAPLRHRIGFAIDIAGFKTKKGHELNVLADFHGKIGQQTCGTAAAKPNPDTKEARELWSIFCQIAATEAFDSGINPNYNASHFDHMHFDLTTDHPILFFP